MSKYIICVSLFVSMLAVAQPAQAFHENCTLWVFGSGCHDHPSPPPPEPSIRIVCDGVVPWSGKKACTDPNRLERFSAFTLVGSNFTPGVSFLNLELYDGTTYLNGLAWSPYPKNEVVKASANGELTMRGETPYVAIPIRYIFYDKNGTPLLKAGTYTLRIKMYLGNFQYQYASTNLTIVEPAPVAPPTPAPPQSPPLPPASKTYPLTFSYNPLTVTRRPYDFSTTQFVKGLPNRRHTAEFLLDGKPVYAPLLQWAGSGGDTRDQIIVLPLSKDTSPGEHTVVVKNRSDLSDGSYEGSFKLIVEVPPPPPAFAGPATVTVGARAVFTLTHVPWENIFINELLTKNYTDITYILLSNSDGAVRIPIKNIAVSANRATVTLTADVERAAAKLATGKSDVTAELYLYDPRYSNSTAHTPLLQVLMENKLQVLSDCTPTAEKSSSRAAFQDGGSISGGNAYLHASGRTIVLTSEGFLCRVPIEEIRLQALSGAEFDLSIIKSPELFELANVPLVTAWDGEYVFPFTPKPEFFTKYPGLRRSRVMVSAGERKAETTLYFLPDRVIFPEKPSYNAGESMRLFWRGFAYSTRVEVLFDDEPIHKTYLDRGQTAVWDEYTLNYLDMRLSETAHSGEHTLVLRELGGGGGQATAQVIITGGKESRKDDPAKMSQPRITLQPSIVAPGKVITVTTSGFSPNTVVTIMVDKTKITRATSYSNNRGEFEVTFTVPPAWKAGLYDVWAIDVNSVYAVTTLTVAGESATASFFTNPNKGTPGLTIRLQGIDWAPQPKSVTWRHPDGATVTVPVDADNCGQTVRRCNDPSELDLWIRVPQNAKAGIHEITVADGSSTATKSFTVVVPDVVGTLGISLSSTKGKPGDTLFIAGKGFTPKSGLTVRFDTESAGVMKGDAMTDSEGSFTGGSIRVPPLSVGMYDVTVLDGLGKSYSQKFEIVGSELQLVPKPTPLPPTPEPAPAPAPAPTLKYCDDTIPVYQQSECTPKPEVAKPAGPPPPECSSDFVPSYQKRSLGCPGY